MSPFQFARVYRLHLSVDCFYSAVDIYPLFQQAQHLPDEFLSFSIRVLACITSIQAEIASLSFLFFSAARLISASLLFEWPVVCSLSERRLCGGKQTWIVGSPRGGNERTGGTCWLLEASGSSERHQGGRELRWGGEGGCNASCMHSAAPLPHSLMQKRAQTSGVHFQRLCALYSMVRRASLCNAEA